MKIDITEYKPAAGIKAPLKIALVADLHDETANQRFIIDKIKEYSPDFIAVPGDVTDRVSDDSPGLDFLRQAARIAPVFYAPGNHERYEESMRGLIEDTGVTLLCNSYTEYKGIKIGGLNSGFLLAEQGIFKSSPSPDLATIEAFSRLDGYKLLLCHHPEYYPAYLKGYDIQLVLSGHAHGGQWRFFGRGVFAPGQGFFPEYTAGMHDGRLVISRGLANNTPYPRLFNRRELVFISLQPDTDIKKGALSCAE